MSALPDVFCAPMPRLPTVLFFAIAITTSGAHAADTASFTIKTMTAQMKYDLDEILVAPGQRVKIAFENGDDLPHNLVFCQPGTDTAAMALKQMETPDEALKRNWLPDDPRIWAHSRMLNPHEKQEISFTAPDKPGVYPYVCTFPGHALTMRGTLKVAPPAGALKGLKFALYHGNWKKLPDFSKLTPHREGPVDDNLLQVKLDDYKNEFGVVFEGTLTAPKKGSYRFFLASDDGARILIDGKPVVTHDGIHPASDIQEEGVQLDKGEHTFRLEYFQAAGQIDLYAAWKGADTLVTPLSKWVHPDSAAGAAKKKKKNDFAPIPLVVKDEPVIYRNFIAGAGNRAIGVGYPGGFNLAWSAESMNLALIWRGAFMDASRHWNSRGGGHQPPLGYVVLRPTGEVTPAFHVTADPAAEWPKWDPANRDESFEWKGYSLDAERRPTFRYTWHEAQVEETYTTTGIATKADQPAALVRTLNIRGTLPANSWIRLAQADRIEVQDTDTYLCHDKNVRYIVGAKNARVAGKNLVVPTDVGLLEVTYRWQP